MQVGTDPKSRGVCRIKHTLLDTSISEKYSMSTLSNRKSSIRRLDIMSTVRQCGSKDSYSSHTNGLWSPEKSHPSHYSFSSFSKIGFLRNIGNGPMQALHAVAYTVSETIKQFS